MKSARSQYYGYRFPPEIISYAVWVYHRFCLSFRDVEDLLAERGIIVSYETIRIWCQKFGPGYARKLKRRQGASVTPGIWTKSLFESTGNNTISGEEQDGDVLAILLQPRRDQRAAERFFRRLVRGQVKNHIGLLPTN